MSAQTKQLHWTQRIALVRHNLHSASRSGDFTFFKTLQAVGLVEGTNHFATLAEAMGDDADMVMAAMDNLNGSLSYIHQDVFQSVYDNLKNSMRNVNRQADRSKLYVDITMQRNKTEMAVDKLCNSAVALTNQHPEQFRDEIASVFITGVCLVSDCIEVVIKQLDSIDQKMDDFIRLEESWNTVKASVIAANASLKGVFYMLDATTSQGQRPQSQRSSSIASAGSSMLRRLSTAFTSQPAFTTQPASRRSSVVSNASLPATSTSPSSTTSPCPVERTPMYVRNSVSSGCPTSMPPSFNNNSNNNNKNNNAAFNANFQTHTLSTIPPTPAYDEAVDPFETAFDPPPIPALPLDHDSRSQVAV